ncbi:unnamed protein product [Prorocentrum cordatum]|uniref:Uncharacterized protein n=1 Tax=Prorocentrum cordatum TaxID=2364126 RepID=A0ABN9VDW4_9DINO|nr:unnamed protein product [Polarella glacialis]
MADYSKWDKLVDSGDEAEPGQLSRQEQCEMHLVRQEEMQQWLRRQIARLDEPGAKRAPGRHPAASSSFDDDVYGGSSGPPELDKFEAAPVRKLTKEERKIVAMFCVVSHFDDGQTNLERHPQMLDLVRHNRWLEEDPGTLELLCRIQASSLKRSGKKQDGPQEDPQEARMRDMLVSGMNTLAGAKKCKLPGGLLEMITAICTPTTDKAREMRVKWQKKEYAKEALLESMFPELRDSRDALDDVGGWKDILMFAGIFLLLIFGTVADCTHALHANLRESEKRILGDTVRVQVALRRADPE